MWGNLRSTFSKAIEMLVNWYQFILTHHVKQWPVGTSAKISKLTDDIVCSYV